MHAAAASPGGVPTDGAHACVGGMSTGAHGVGMATSPGSGGPGSAARRALPANSTPHDILSVLARISPSYGLLSPTAQQQSSRSVGQSARAAQATPTRTAPGGFPSPGSPVEGGIGSPMHRPFWEELEGLIAHEHAVQERQQKQQGAAAAAAGGAPVVLVAAAPAAPAAAAVAAAPAEHSTGGNITLGARGESSSSGGDVCDASAVTAQLVEASRQLADAQPEIAEERVPVAPLGCCAKAAGQCISNGHTSEEAVSSDAGDGGVGVSSSSSSSGVQAGGGDGGGGEEQPHATEAVAMEQAWAQVTRAAQGGDQVAEGGGAIARTSGGGTRRQWSWWRGHSVVVVAGGGRDAGGGGCGGESAPSALHASPSNSAWLWPASP